jgi:2-oxoglutarate dehydrogenase E2 component (dihydrolipoamide succinyltransferase)
MAVELKIPEAGESITEVRIGAWRKSEGDFVAVDEVVVEIETDKAAMELPSPARGTLGKILKREGANATIGEVIGLIEEGGGPKDAPAESPGKEVAGCGPRPAASQSPPEPRVMPSAQRVLGEAGIPVTRAKGTGPGGRVLKEDALVAVDAAASEPEPVPTTPAASEPRPAPAPRSVVASHREEESVPMTPMRKVISRNLVAAQQNAALLTTFNEVDMTAVIELRRRYKDAFKERHGVKLGFMSFFVKASVDALQTVPAVNSRIDGNQIVYHKYHDIGIAVGGGRGLVVPVLRNVESMGFADIERAITDFAVRARRNKIELSELQGGTFTISNGGIYGSMLSTPIVNPPQSGILGMHAIRDRPAAVNGQVEIRPMMYLALTYDHRIVDGREAVTFLKRIKDLVQSPERIWLQV